jgi:outer membrane protein assembly factor BamB
MSENATSNQSEIVCSGCGRNVPSSLEYCNNCGKKLVKVFQEEKQASQEPVTEEGWPMIRHDPACTGSDGSTIKVPLERAWEFQASGNIESPLAAAYGMVFFGCKDKCLYAVDAISGIKKWAFKTGGEITTCPVVSNGVVYAASKDKNIYAVEVKNGLKKWQFSTREEICTPAFAEGIVFFGCKDKNIYAIDAGTGQKKWHFCSDFKEHHAPIPIQGKLIISGSGFMNKKLFAIDIGNGTLSWELKDYVANPYPVAVKKDMILARAPRNHIALIEAAIGKDKGQLASQETTTTAKSGDFLFVVSSATNGLYAWDMSRQTTAFTGWDWQAHMEERTLSETTTGGGFVFVSTIGQKKLYGVNCRKFMKRWEFTFNESIKSSPIIAGGMLFLATDKGKIHAFKGTTNPHAVSMLEYVSGEIAPWSKFKVILYQPQYVWPNCCCLCCGSAEKTITLSKTEGKMTLQMPNLPYCNACHEKTQKIFGKRERPGVEIQKVRPTVLAFRNERYWSKFKESNLIR